MLWPVSIHIRINAPMAMRYQPNDLKPYLERKLTNHFMASKATMKATTQPMRSIIRFSDVAHPVPTASLPTKSSSTSSPVAAAMVGTARKKENSAALRRVSFWLMPPTIVDMERLVPGIMDRHCITPIQKAFSQ